MKKIINCGFEPHLSIYPWYLRLWLAIKYIFGYKSRYGNWDSTIIKIDDVKRIRMYFDTLIDEDIKRKLSHENKEEKSDI